MSVRRENGTAVIIIVKLQPRTSDLSADSRILIPQNGAEAPPRHTVRESSATLGNGIVSENYRTLTIS
jgi:hypothetical protein